MPRFAAAFLFCTSLTCWQLTAQGQSLVAPGHGGATFASTATPPSISPPSEAATVRVHGTVHCPEGRLPGAVIHLNGTRTYVVSDAQGNFELEVPGATKEVAITCSYTGFRDTVQRLPVKAAKAAPTTVLLDKATKLPPRDRSGETSWW